MTSAEILKSTAPPMDDEIIDRAIADLDTKIWRWAEALKGAETQLKSTFAAPIVAPAVAPMVAPRPSGRASASLFESVPAGLSAAAAAAHIPSVPSMPSEWTAPPAAPQEWQGSHGGHGASASKWKDEDDEPVQKEARSETGGVSGPGVMQWPNSPTSAWPGAEATAPASSGAQEWPTWTPADTSGESTSSTKKSSKSSKAAKQARAMPEGPTPEERAQKAAAEEALLAQLEDAIARRVRLLRRLDPDTAIEKLIEKATQGHAEAMAAAPPKDDKAGSSSSWWRRK